MPQMVNMFSVTFFLCSLLAKSFAVQVSLNDFNNNSVLPCYDYIIVGGGISGLVVANRLTEDSKMLVLVIEAGTIDQYEDSILVPENVGDDMNTQYDWNVFTVPQTYLDGKARPYDMGKVLGGGSIINGMCWNRGGREDFDAWEALGNPGWGWEGLLPYFKKSENYTFNVDAEFSSKLYIHPDESTHGHDGYVHVSYPKFFYNQSQNFLEGMAELGIPILTDPNNGTGAGAMLIPNDINPENQTRSDARRNYYDPFALRPNFHVITGQHVTRLLLDPRALPLSQRDSKAGIFVNGVEFAENEMAPRRTVSCSREIIMAAGNVHTPQILQLSGIGPSELLEGYEIPIVLPLPGVGNNFQDHAYVGAVYQYNNSSYFTSMILNDNQDLQTAAAVEYYFNKTGPWTAGAINTVAFPSLSSITDKYTQILAAAAFADPTTYLIPGLNPSIVSGYAAQKTLLIQLLASNKVGAYELLNNNFGLLSVSAMHTFSRGTVMINGTNPFVTPLIDPRWCSNPIDCEILVEALLFNNKLVNTKWMRDLLPAQVPPFTQNTTREAILDAIHANLRTEFHGTGATSMMPLELGGVVDNSLRVYGTTNLRIVDAGIMPLVPAAHIQAVVYAVAEKAADIVKAERVGLSYRGCEKKRPHESVSTFTTSLNRVMFTSSSAGLVFTTVVAEGAGDLSATTSETVALPRSDLIALSSEVISSTFVPISGNILGTSSYGGSANDSATIASHAIPATQGLTALVNPVLPSSMVPSANSPKSAEHVPVIITETVVDLVVVTTLVTKYGTVTVTTTLSAACPAH